MKLLDIAFKDLLRSMRSASALVFMFAVPLLVTGMFFLMFRSIFNKDEDSFGLPQTQVIIANLDQGSPALSQWMTAAPQDQQADSLGELIQNILQQEQFASLMQVSLASDANGARTAVDTQKAEVALIIPEDFSASFVTEGKTAQIELYQDPTLTIGPQIVASVLNQFMDSFSGVKIAIATSLEQIQDPAMVGEVVQEYMADVQSSEGDTQILVQVQSPGTTPKSGNPVMQIVGPIMGGMMIFYAFYTATATAQTIIREQETGTLQRLFTTPTAKSTILGGKYLATMLTVLVQMTVLTILARFIFNIDWGASGPLALIILGTVACASAFGIFISSLTKTTRQGGLIFGLVLTTTGMIGMMPIFVASTPNPPKLLTTVSLFVPQGWALQGLTQSMATSPWSELLVTFLMLIAISVILFAIGVLRFRNRFSAQG
jgi:ABC-2 type transport system permease protein